MVMTDAIFAGYVHDWDWNRTPFKLPKVLHILETEWIDLSLLIASGVKELYAPDAKVVYGSCALKKSFDVLYLPNLERFDAENCHVKKLHVPGCAKCRGKFLRVDRVFFTTEKVDEQTAADFMPRWLLDKVFDAKEKFEMEVYESGRFDFNTYDPGPEFERFLYKVAMWLVAGCHWTGGYFDLYEHSKIDEDRLESCVKRAKKSVLEEIEAAEKKVLDYLQTLKDEYKLTGEAAQLLEWGFVTNQENSFEERRSIAKQLTTPDGVEVFKREWAPWQTTPTVS